MQACARLTYLALPRLAPSFMAAACYTVFGRIVWWVTPQESRRVRLLWCPTRYVAALFVLVDTGSFLVQLLGAGAVGAAYSNHALSAHDRQERARTGRAALKLGIGVQVACSGAFTVVATRFLVVSRRWVGRSLPYAAHPGASWTRLTWAVNASSLLLMVRPSRPQARLLLTSDRRPGPRTASSSSAAQQTNRATSHATSGRCGLSRPSPC